MLQVACSTCWTRSGVGASVRRRWLLPDESSAIPSNGIEQLIRARPLWLSRACPVRPPRRPGVASCQAHATLRRGRGVTLRIGQVALGNQYGWSDALGDADHAPPFEAMEIGAENCSNGARAQPLANRRSGW